MSGTTIEKTPDGDSPGVFSAVFERTGAFRSPVTIIKLDTAIESSGPPNTRSAPAQTVHQRTVVNDPQSTSAISLASSMHSVSSPDGNIYFFQEDGHLHIVSPVGSVENEFKFMPPGDGLRGTQMGAAGRGFFFISYDHIATGESGENGTDFGMIAVVYSLNGEVTALYRRPQIETDFSVAACAVSSTDFLFLGTDEKGNLDVVHYQPD